MADTSSSSISSTKLKKGSKVLVKRRESYWYNQYGTVINIEQSPSIRYPVTVRFLSYNYAGVNTQNYSPEELLAQA